MKKKRKRREIESPEQQLEREALAQKVARDADDANVQVMIERSIKDHGA